jgi:hypothetical protein
VHGTTSGITRRTASSGYKLLPMTSYRACLPLVLFFIGNACVDDKTTPPDSTAAASETVSPVPATIPNTGWDAAVSGPVLLLSVAEHSATTFVVLPYLSDSTIEPSMLATDSLADTPVELFSRRGLSGSTALVVVPDSARNEGCLSWPVARLAEIPSEPWKVGFVRGVVAALPLDSLEVMRNADSTAVTTELARLSSALAEGDDPAFRGLPFSVRKAYRFGTGETAILVGDIVRKINEEANPREEHLLVIAERPAASTGPYSAVFHTRVAGAEDAVRTNEILAAVRFVRGNRPALVVSFEYEDGGRVVLLQRTSAREWRMTWRSAYTGC